ncbi:MAG: hypothetical protein HOH04_03605 [Rhodospirillaceae bacterium]|jgi:hypothetical protein|nr:hypothetical protein [Rhodospirillaceae bacterium]
MYIIRQWATRHARSLEVFYQLTARLFHACDAIWVGIGIARLERPFAVVESWTKGVLFDCRMCGRCHLSVTGMTCVMNCPKAIRNGPCGGVRANGHCEVKPAMPCVWVEAWKGAQSMRLGNAIRVPLAPRDHAIEGTSAWLRLSAENIDRQRTAKRRADEVLS